MTGNEYQALAMRTNDRKGTERLLFLANAANKHGVEELQKRLSLRENRKRL